MAKTREILVCNPRPLRKNPCIPCINPSKRRKNTSSLLEKFNKLQDLSLKSEAHHKYLSAKLDGLIRILELGLIE